MRTNCYILEGKVQGVSCRAHIQMKANELGLAGWVRNLKDGRVQAVFQGEESLIEQIYQYCLSGPGRAVVNKLDLIALSEDETYNSFEIRADGEL